MSLQNHDSDLNPFTPVLRGHCLDGAKTVVDACLSTVAGVISIQFCGRNNQPLRFLTGSFPPVSQHCFACEYVTQDRIALKPKQWTLASQLVSNRSVTCREQNAVIKGTL